MEKRKEKNPMERIKDEKSIILTKKVGIFVKI